MVCLISANRQNCPGAMNDEMVAAAAVPSSSQEDHKNSAVSVLILAFALLSSVDSFSRGLAEGISIRQVGQSPGHTRSWQELSGMSVHPLIYRAGAGGSCNIST